MSPLYTTLYIIVYHTPLSLSLFLSVPFSNIISLSLFLCPSLYFVSPRPSLRPSSPVNNFNFSPSKKNLGPARDRRKSRASRNDRIIFYRGTSAVSFFPRMSPVCVCVFFEFFFRLQSSGRLNVYRGHAGRYNPEILGRTSDYRTPSLRRVRRTRLYRRAGDPDKCPKMTKTIHKL